MLLGGVLGLVSASAWGQASWTFEKPYVWARDKDSVALEKQGDRLVVRHTAQTPILLPGVAHDKAVSLLFQRDRILVTRPHIRLLKSP